MPSLKASGILLTLKSPDADLHPDPPASTSLVQEAGVARVSPPPHAAAPGWAFAAMPHRPLGSGRTYYTLMTSGM